MTLSNAKKGGILFVGAFASMMVLGAGIQATPEGRAKEAERQRKIAVEDAAKAKAKADDEKRTADAEAAVSAEKAKVKADADEVERVKGTHCLSGWDGSYRPLVEFVKQNARNPSSFEHISTVMTPINKNGFHVVIMKYRAENGFGGMNIEAIAANVEPGTCNIDKIVTG